MLYYAVATVVAFLLFGLFVYANPDPVQVYVPGGYYQEMPVWIIALIGAVIGILLEFLFTRRLWAEQRQQLTTAQSRLEKSRAKVKELGAALQEGEAELERLRAEVGEGAGEAPGEGESREAEDEEEEAPI